MIELKEYQHAAVDGTLKQLRKILTKSGSDKISVFKAPTGSGKTIMMAELLKRMSQEDMPNRYVFVWTSLFDLHSQSKGKLDSYLRDTRYDLIALDEITQDALSENTVLFANWHSMTTTKKDNDSSKRSWSNVYVKDREDGRSIVSVLDATRQQGIEVILIVDESHRNYLTDNSQRFIREVIKPKLTLEVSATPTTKIDAEALANNESGWTSVSFEDVVKSGLIKQETSINEEIGSYANIGNSAEDVVLSAALAKHSELTELYKAQSIDVKPLLLVQLPSKSEKMSVLDQDVHDEVEALLVKNDITYENGKLAIWLSEDKKNLENIESNDSDVEVLIFKEAVAVGWDCPRAQILVMLREIGSLTFEIQTVGRILRMPEARHYDNKTLNKAYIYTNLENIRVNDSPEDLDFFKNKSAHIKDGTENISLPSTYLHRQDYGDLTLSFRNILVQALNDRFNIEATDMVNVAYEKADTDLELYPEELTTPLLSDVVVHNLDDIEDEVGSLDHLNRIQAEVSHVSIEKHFNYLMKIWSKPYAPARSYGKIKSAFYQWFEYIGFDKSKWDEVQRIIACSTSNQSILNEVIKTAKLEYEQIKPDELADRKTMSNNSFSLPVVDLFGENYEEVAHKKYPYNKCYLQTGRSKPESYFEKMLDNKDTVRWWYKNGEAKQHYFAVPYRTKDEETGLVHLRGFYPDFIVKYEDETIGIYDTKSGHTVTDQVTYDKSDALQAYIKKQNANGQKLKGGILNKRDDGLYVFEGTKYDTDLSKWSRFV